MKGKIVGPNRFIEMRGKITRFTFEQPRTKWSIFDHVAAFSPESRYWVTAVLNSMVSEGLLVIQDSDYVSSHIPEGVPMVIYL